MSMNRRRFFTVTAAAALGTTALATSTTLAHAVDIKPLTQANLEDAIATGRPIAVRFFETWCPNCTRQGRVLNQIVSTDEKYEDFIVLEGEFSANRSFASRFGIRQRTSVAVFKDAEFVDAVVGETRESALRTLLDQAL